MANTIELQQVAKSFGKQRVLKDIDLTLKQGEILGLIGPSGAGKSTVINIALGVEQADKGQANILNKIMPNRELLAEIGYMAQSDALYEALTAYENIAFFAEMKGIKKQGLDREIKRVAEIVALGDFLYKNVAGFSGGDEATVIVGNSLNW